MKWSIRAFQALDSDSRGFIYKDELLDHIRTSGTITTHQLLDMVHTLEEKGPKHKIYLEEFEELIKGRNFIKTVLENNLIIP